MSSTLQFRLSAGSRWLLSVTCYLVPLILAGYAGFRFHDLNAHPSRWLMMLFALASIWSTLHSSAKTVVELAVADGNLLLTTAGRPPLVPVGPKAVTTSVPAGSDMKWIKSALFVRPQPGAQRVAYTLAAGVSRKDLRAWFTENGLALPKGLN